MTVDLHFHQTNRCQQCISASQWQSCHQFFAEAQPEMKVLGVQKKTGGAVVGLHAGLQY